MRKIFSFTFFVFSTWLVLAQTQIKGIVIDEEQAKNIPNATVSLYEHGESNALEQTRTNANGEFTLSNSYKA